MNVVTLLEEQPPREKDGPEPCAARVNRAWEGQTVVVIGGGPSLKRDDVDACAGLRCIAVNDAYLLAPWADVLYFADSKWLRWQLNGRDGAGLPALDLTAEELKRRFKTFAGLRVSITNARPSMPSGSALFLGNWNEVPPQEKPKPDTTLSSSQTHVATGHNSAFQALNIAVLAGASKIVLLGVDGRVGASGKRHWFGDHPDRTEPPYDAMRVPFARAALECYQLGVKVINCSPGTVIDSFAVMNLGDALRQDAAMSPDPPAAPRSDYEIVSDVLRACGREGAHVAELRIAAPSGADRAVAKGIRKGTFVALSDERYAHAACLEPAPRSALVQA